ncbi:protein NETWORKED 4B-like [Andrographis paniculata]|uniref:protein NETWORKED 4B-like n=1 Tax=Andrographis paniculata TaxID=175694 RepID=UPI0021E89D20|nr:protein NETWORKED 4B-like [Andrographis paniculata]
MASSLGKSGKMKRMESKKSHSWWWDSHITPKNNKWLQENLEEMDDLVKRMLKLIEEDADSFAKKAELYFKKRPELVTLVEEFYRMYRALAERYDLVSGELRKTIPADLQSQSSGVSDAASEPLPTTQSPEQRPRRSKSGPRAAGFDVFLGNGSEANNKEEEEEEDNGSVIDSDSDSESDDSSTNDSSKSDGNENELQRRVEQLEAELEEWKQKAKINQDETCESCKEYKGENIELSNKIASYEEELGVAKGKIQRSEEEIAHLSAELQKYAMSEVFVTRAEYADSTQKSRAVEEELSATKEKLLASETKVESLRQELTNMEENLKSAEAEVSVWKDKLEREIGEVSKLHDRVESYKTNLADRDQEISMLREAMSNANKSLSEENEQLKEEIARMTKERTYLEDNLKEFDIRCQSAVAAKVETEVTSRDKIEQLKTEVKDRDNRIEEVKQMLDELTAAKGELNVTITVLSAEIKQKDDNITQMGSHLHQLHMQHVELIAAAEKARKHADELQGKVKELETEVKIKQEVINEVAERKREAIRQLCFSLEHYRSGYHELRRAVVAHKRPAVIAA